MSSHRILSKLEVAGLARGYQDYHQAVDAARAAERTLLEMLESLQVPTDANISFDGDKGILSWDLPPVVPESGLAEEPGATAS